MKDYVSHPEKCVTVHSGIDLKKFENVGGTLRLRKEFSISPGTFVVGNTSALEGHKDYFTFIDTIEHLVKDGMPVVGIIIGKGSLEDRLKAYVQHKKIESHVRFAGFRRDIEVILPELDVFLITSNEEGLGTSVLDAFAARVPVVATAAGGIPEMVENRFSGLLAPVYDSERLAAHVKEILEQPVLRQKLIEGATSKLRDFDKVTTARKTLDVYWSIKHSIPVKQ